MTVTLQWDANPAEQEVINYKVYEHVSESYNLLQSSATPAVSLIDVPAGVHSYAVTALNASGESPKSSDATTLDVDVNLPTGSVIITIQ